MTSLEAKTEEGRKRQPIAPAELQAPDATLYRAGIAIACQELQLIWQRYTGFIVVNGFLVNALTNDAVRNNKLILGWVGLIVLILNCIWHMLNYCGWHNQNVAYRQAGNMFSADVGLITDYFRNKNYKPVGWIYWLAQTVPIMFSLIAIPCLAQGIDQLFSIGAAWSCSIGTLLWLLAASIVFWAEYYPIAKRSESSLTV